MKIINKIGATLIIAGFVLLAIVPFFNQYKLTDDVFKNSISDSTHFAVLKPALQPLVNKTFNTSFEFASAFDKIFNQLNESYKAKQQWDKVIYSNYTLSVTKASLYGGVANNTSRWLLAILALIVVGSLLYISKYLFKQPGIQNDNIFKKSHSSRGWLGIFIGTGLIIFYIILYWFPQYISPYIILVNPISKILSGGDASQWFLYGFMYTVAVLVMGIRMILKYRHSRYQIIRTLSVMFFQTAIAFIIPEILVSLNKPYFDFKNIWPLNYTFFFDWNINNLTSSGNLGIFMFVWGLILLIVAVPTFTYFYGKRWYCSWVCGCGGLAETLGDPFRQLSDKSLKAWKFERISVNSVLVFVTVMTAVTLITYFTNYKILGDATQTLQKYYGFAIGSVFAGVVGTGFYPLMGNRTWCRFGCPLAAILGIMQRFKSKFRITTNGGQCISCGNCSTYCEMGIDVRWYAQRGENIVRSSCVGCGVCSAVCPRGVLKLENADEKGRISNGPIMIGNDGITILK